ncbi:MAG: LysM peptidoglycan-binding domain-containing M23 family metallopeptidase [Candidatus Omnitrophota bacterium]
MKRKFILILLIFGLAGCVSAPQYNRPIAPALTNMPGIYHRVEAGQTLWRISKLYDINLDEILRVNRNLESSRIEIGQMIFIPNRRSKARLSVNYASDDFIWPLKGKVIGSFGANYRNFMNKGLNIQPYSNADIVAARSGKVVFYAKNFGNYGKTLIIDHGDGLRSVYARNSEVYVRIGETVKKGALIARAGSCGRDKGVYLHFEIRKGANPQNPLFFLP